MGTGYLASQLFADKISKVNPIVDDQRRKFFYAKYISDQLKGLFESHWEDEMRADEF